MWGHSCSSPFNKQQNFRLVKIQSICRWHRNVAKLRKLAHYRVKSSVGKGENALFVRWGDIKWDEWHNGQSWMSPDLSKSVTKKQMNKCIAKI